jgi:hypothetical protein
VSQASGQQWQGSLSELTSIVNTIRRSQAFGRLTLRNSARIGVVHLYFHYGRLVHIVGNRGGMQETLADLREWTEGTARFERSGPIQTESMKDGDEQLFNDVLADLQRRRVLALKEQPRVVKGEVIAPEEEQAITSLEWQALIAGTRRISHVVARLVGPGEARNVLKDILADCTAAYPAFSCLQISLNGYLQLTSSSQLEHLPRREVLDGFAALFATCQYFCFSIIGEDEVHKLFMQTLGDLRSTLVGLDVFRLNKRASF